MQQILRIGARNIGKKDIASALLHIFFTLSRETSGILKEDEWCETVEQAIITIQKVYFL